MLRCELDIMEYVVTTETESLEGFDEVDLDEIDD